MKNIKLVLISVVLFVLFSFFVFAEDSSYIYKKDTVIDLKVPCIFNGTHCSAGAVCNISINYPNSSEYNKNVVMTNNLVYHNFTMPTTSVTGEYPVLVYCTDAGFSNYKFFKININNNGIKENNTPVIAMVIVSAFMVLFIILTITLTTGYRYLFLILSFLFGTILSFILYTFTSEVTQSMSSIFYVIFIISLILTFLVFMFCMIELTLNVLNYYTTRKSNQWEQFEE